MTGNVTIPVLVPQAPAGGDQNRGLEMIILYWTMSIIVMIVMALRFYARLSIRAIGIDDWLMLATSVILIALTCVLTYQASQGGFRHLFYMKPHQIIVSVKCGAIAEALGVFSYITGKAAVGFLILRLLGPSGKWQKWTVYFFSALIALLNIIDIIFTFAQCSPPRALWDRTIPHTCWNPNILTDYSIAASCINVLIDIVFSLLPATIFWNLNISVRKRVSLCTLLGLGLFTAVSGIVKITYLTELNAQSDITWDTFSLVCWAGAEIFVTIVLGSIPPLKPLFDRYIEKTSGHTRLRGEYPLVTTELRFQKRTNDVLYRETARLDGESSFK